MLDAYCAGVWMLVWTQHTLWWAPKPTLVAESGTFGWRLHCDNGPACQNTIENLYFFHGVLVPAYAVMRPEWITLDEIKRENSEEVRRTLIERYGWEKYLTDSGAVVVDQRRNDRDAQMERLFTTDGGARRFVCMDPSTGRRYALGVPRDIATCAQAQAWMSHGLDRFAIHRS